MILDTSFLIDVMRRDAAATGLLDRLEAGSEALHLPAPVHYELWEGIERSANPIRELDAVERTLAGYPPLDLTTAAAQRAGRISARLIRQGRRVDDVDVLIAGIALERGETLVTRDVEDFGRIEDLQVMTY